MAVIYDESKVPKLQLKNISAIKKIEETKHGKKSAAYQIIKELGDLDMSDIAIYAAMYLAGIKQKPTWTVDELKDQLTRKDFVDDKLLPLLEKSDKFQSLPEAEKKKKAYEVAQSIADSEAEIIQIVNEHITANSSKTQTTLAHQLTPGQLRQMTAMLTKIITTLGKMYRSEEPELATLIASMVWYTDSKKTTNLWFNTLLRDIAAMIGLALKDIKDAKREKEISEKEFATLNSLQKQFEVYQRELNEYEGMNILWPESEKDIKGITGIKQYMAEVEVYRNKAKAIINQYAKRKDRLMGVKSDEDEENVALEAKGWDDTKVQALVRRTVREAYKNIAVADATEKAAFVNAKAEELLKTQRGLGTFLSQNSYDPEGELAGLLGRAVNSVNTMKGRPTENMEEI